MPIDRKTYEESCRLLQGLGYLPEGELPVFPTAMPTCDDEILSVSFFRTFLGEDCLDNLTLPRTFIGRSEIRGTKFKNCDLSESCLCWNDFIESDFTEACLVGSDLRASVFEKVIFLRTDLRNADLRRARFQDCDFTAAIVRGAKLGKDAKVLQSLTLDQLREIDYQPEGEEPPGG